MRKLLMKIALTTGLLASPALAEVELSFYLGSQSSPHSTMSGSHPAIGAFSKRIGWDGRSFDAPIYYGLRAVWWRNENFGWGIEATHTKAYAPAAEMAPQFSRLEFTDGHNIITLNAHRRWKDQWMKGRVTPYVAGGIGIAVPHVDITPVGGARTFGYQLTGAAVRLTAGAQYAINDRWNIFAEYQFTYSENKATLDGGGTISGHLITNALNFGVGWSF